VLSGRRAGTRAVRELTRVTGKKKQDANHTVVIRARASLNALCRGPRARRWRAGLAARPHSSNVQQLQSDDALNRAEPSARDSWRSSTHCSQIRGFAF